VTSQLLLVPFSSLRVNKRKLKKLDQRKALRYMQDIDAGDRLPPIKVEHCGDGQFNVWDGRHRYLAHLWLGATMVEVEVVGGVPMTQIWRRLRRMVWGLLAPRPFYFSFFFE